MERFGNAAAVHASRSVCPLLGRRPSNTTTTAPIWTFQEPAFGRVGSKSMGVAPSSCGQGMGSTMLNGRPVFRHHCAAFGLESNAPNRPGGIFAAGPATHAWLPTDPNDLHAAVRPPRRPVRRCRHRPDATRPLGFRWPARCAPCRPSCNSCSAAARLRPAVPAPGPPSATWLTALRNAQGSVRGDPCRGPRAQPPVRPQPNACGPGAAPQPR